MMHDWNAFRDSLMERVGDYAQQSPDVLRGLTTINNAAAKTGNLEPKVHELIALAVTVTTRCAGCIAVPVQKMVTAMEPRPVVLFFWAYAMRPKK